MLFGALYTTLPQAYRIVPGKGGAYVYKPSPLLASAPTLQTEPEQVVTYKLNPKAVWNDGTPITSADLQYTWQQITTGEDIYDTTGYDKIKSVETPDPQTAVVTYSEPFASWKARITRRPVSSPHAPAGGCSVARAIPVISQIARSNRHISSRTPCTVDVGCSGWSREKPGIAAALSAAFGLYFIEQEPSG